MSEETFDREEDGFTFSDEDFSRRYFPEQKRPGVAGVSSPRRTAQIHGGLLRYTAGEIHSCERCAVVSPQLHRTDRVRVVAPHRRSPGEIGTGSLPRPDINA